VCVLVTALCLIVGFTIKTVLMYERARGCDNSATPFIQ